MVRLLTSLCVSRNMYCIEQVSASLPAQCCLAAIKNSSLPCTLRAAFCGALLTVHINREPHHPQLLPNLVRSYPPTDSHKESASPRSMEMISKFNNFALSHLRTHAAQIYSDRVGANQLTKWVLRVCSQIVRYGLLTNQEQISELSVVLMQVLDGRGVSGYADSPIDGTTDDWQTDARYEYNSNSAEIFKCKEEILKIASKLSLMLHEAKVDSIVKCFHLQIRSEELGTWVGKSNLFQASHSTKTKDLEILTDLVRYKCPELSASALKVITTMFICTVVPGHLQFHLTGTNFDLLSRHTVN